MARTNPRKKIWVEAVTAYIQRALSIYGCNLLSAIMPNELLDFFASKARERKTAKDRNGVWYEHLRDTLVTQMLRQDIAERKSDYGNTHYMLVPNLKMGKGEAGEVKYLALVELVGVNWAKQLVNITSWDIPKHIVRVTVTDPRVDGGKEIKDDEVHEEETVTEYSFIGEGSTTELLWWTVALGNKPTLDIGPASKRVKAGKERNQR